MQYQAVSIEKKIWPENIFINNSPNRRKEEDMTTIARYTKKLVRYLRTTRGVSALEYAILVGVIAVAIGAALTTFSGQIKTAMEAIGTDVGAIKGGGTPKLK